MLTTFLSAASAIAANTFLRSIAGAVFPLFSQYMVCMTFKFPCCETSAYFFDSSTRWVSTGPVLSLAVSLPCWLLYQSFSTYTAISCVQRANLHPPTLRQCKLKTITRARRSRRNHDEKKDSPLNHRSFTLSVNIFMTMDILSWL